MGAKPVLAPAPAISVYDDSPAPAWYTYFAMLSIDIAALSVVYWLAVIGRHVLNPGSLRLYYGLFPGIAVFLLAFYVQGLYPGLLLHPAEEMRRIFYCVTTVFLLFVCTTFLWHNAQWYSRSIFLITWALGSPAVLFARYGARHLFARHHWWGIPAVVLGSGPVADRVIQALDDRTYGVRVTATIDEFALRAQSASLTPVAVERRRAEPSIARSGYYAILALADKTEMELHHVLQDYCKGFRHILLIPDMPGICSLGVTAREIGGEVGFEVPQRLFHKTARVSKRLLDVPLSLLALLVLSPLFALIAIAVKLSTPGPVFYGHKRHGRGGNVFRALKFRTMYKDGDRILEEYLEKFPDERRVWERDQKLRNDPRVTPIGKLLRRCSLDELPQLWNVLIGDMSLVGPRPIVGSEVARYGRGYDLYTRVLPGITGLWQVSGRNNTTYEERVTLDEYYVRNWSIWLDAYILIRTIKVVATAEGAY